MARPSKPWFRVYTETMSDRKIRRLAPSHRWLWIAVLSAARQSSIPGLLLVSEHEPMLADDLADIAALSVKDVREGMRAFEQAGMVDIDAEWCEQPTWRVVAWKERQYESDTSTDRTRKHRSKERSIDVAVTAVVAPPESETETESETEKTTPPESTQIEAQPTPPIVVEDDGFDEFWQQYPRRDSVRVGKQAARKAWLRIPASKRADVVAALAVYVTRCGEKPKDAERWLKPGVWDEWLTLDVGANAAPVGQPTEVIRVINGVRHRHSSGAGFIPIVDTPVLVPDLEDYEL